MAAPRARMSEDAGIRIEAIYSRSGFFQHASGAITSGVYELRLAGFSGAAHGDTMEVAIAELVDALREWVEDAAAEQDEYPHRRTEIEGPPLMGLVRRLLEQGDLHSEVRKATPEPVLDERDEPGAG